MRGESPPDDTFEEKTPCVGGREKREGGDEGSKRLISGEEAAPAEKKTAAMEKNRKG